MRDPPEVLLIHETWSELKRRRVVRTAGVYAVSAWVVIEVASTTFPILMLPAWSTRLVLALAILGFPCALVLSWLFDLRPSADAAVPVPALPTRVRRTLRIAAASMMLLGVTGAAFAFAHDRGPALNARRVFVATFSNRTSDAALSELGHMAADWITQGLFRSQLGEVVDQTTATILARQLDTVQRPDSSTLPLESAIASGAGTLITGAYYLRGDTVLLHAQLIDARTRRVIRIIDPIAALRSDPMAGVEKLKQRVVAAVAVLLDEAHGGSSALSTPPSFDAYNEFTRGREAETRGLRGKAKAHYERAASMDTTFIAARIELIQTDHNGVGNWTRGDSLAAAMLARPELLSTAERVRLERLRARFAGDLEGAYRASKKWLEFSPPVATNISVDAMRIGRLHEVIEMVESMDPKARSAYDWGRHWVPLLTARHLLGQHRRELRAARLGQTFYDGVQLPILSEIEALAALGREKEVLAAIERGLVKRNSGDSERGVWQVAVSELRVHGHEDASRRVAQAGLKWVESRRNEERLTAMVLRTESSMRESLGDFTGALAALDRLVASEDSAFLTGGRLRAYGVLLARAGQRDRADSVLTILLQPPAGPRAGEIRAIANRELSAGIVSAALGRPDDAVRLMRIAESHGSYLMQATHLSEPVYAMREYAPLKELLRVKD